MRILRRHQGFTTNSSASSEWISDPIDNAVPLMAVRPTASGASHASIPATGSTSAATPATTPAPRPTVLWDNLQVVGGLLLAVLGIFALERWIRRRLRRREDDDG